MENKENQYMEIDLMQIAKAILRRIWAVVLVAVATAAVAFAYASYVVTPTYQSSAFLYVNNNSISIGSSLSLNYSALTAARTLVDTYSVILKTRTTLETVIERAGLNMSYDELYGMVQTSSVNNTEIFKVVVTSTDPREAEVIANTIASVLPEKIADIVDNSSVKIVDYAIVGKRISPNVTKYTVAGGALGFVLICGIIVLMELNDNVIKDEDYLIQTYSLPVLAAIPDLDDTTAAGSYYSYGGARRSGRSGKTGGRS